MRCNIDIQLLDRVLSLAQLQQAEEAAGNSYATLDAMLCEAVADLFCDANDTAHYITDYVHKSGPTMKPVLADGRGRTAVARSVAG